MNQDRSLVLGSGISALAYLFYNPDAMAIAGSEVGGLFKQAADLGPQYVWVTKSTTKLMADLDLHPGTREVRIGYYYLGRLWNAQELKDSGHWNAFRGLYSMRTRGTAPKSSHMSSSEGSFEVFTIPVQELVEVLLSRVNLRLIMEKADFVSLQEQRVHTEGLRNYKYDTLVSTVPAPIFLKLIERNDAVVTLRAADKVYQKCTTLLPFEHDMIERGFEYTYVADEGDFHRTKLSSFIGGGPFVVREYTLLKEINGLDGKIQKGGQILGGHEILSSIPKNVELLGRYAEWRHDRRLEDVLEVVQ